MKANLHPQMHKVTVKCACGASFEAESTRDKVSVEICSECHPFYTGKQGTGKKAGSIEKFNRRYNMNQDKKAE